MRASPARKVSGAWFGFAQVSRSCAGSVPCTISTRLTARPLPSQRTQNSPVVGRVRAVLITSRSRSLKFGSIGSPRTLRILKSPGFAPPSWRSIASGRYHRALSRGTWRRRRRQAPGLRRPGCRTADGADRGTDAGYRDAYGRVGSHTPRSGLQVLPQLRSSTPNPPFATLSPTGTDRRMLD